MRCLSLSQVCRNSLRPSKKPVVRKASADLTTLSCLSVQPTVDIVGVQLLFNLIFFHDSNFIQQDFLERNAGK